MAYDTWDWDKTTGVGYPSGVELKRQSPTLRQSSDAGYVSTRPAFTRDRWLIGVSFALIRPAGFIYLVDFFHSHRGGTPFYWKCHFGFYGIPYTYELADPGGISPWSSEIDPGYGDAPTWLVRFNADDLPLSRLKMHDNYWATSSPIELITI